MARLPARRDLEGDGRTFDISRIREQKLVVSRVKLVLVLATKYYQTYKENGTMTVRVKITRITQLGQISYNGPPAVA